MADRYVRVLRAYYTHLKPTNIIMEDYIEIIDNLQRDILSEEISCADLKTLNENFCNKDSLILHINVRSLNANYNKLRIFIDCLKTKPCVIVCTETWYLNYYKYLALSGYKIFYNNSNINKSDGVVVYIEDSVNESTKIIEIGKLKIVNTLIKLNNNSNLELSVVYRSHDIPTLEFIMNLKNHLNNRKNSKNHLVIGDFNINIMDENDISHEFLNNFLEKGFILGFTGITRPSDNNNLGTCIDNIFIKTNSLLTKTFKISVPITDHYPLFITLNKLPKSIDKTNRYLYDYKKLENIAKT